MSLLLFNTTPGGGVTLLYAYNADEASGALIDYSGNGLNVTLTGALIRTASATGHSGTGSDKALSQSSASADSAGPTITGLQTANYTVMAWVKRSSNSIDGWFCELKAGGSGDRGILFSSGAVQSRCRNAAGTVVGPSVTQPAINVWYHCAGSYDGTNVILFINGVQVASAALSAPLKSTSTGSHLMDTLGSETILDDIRYYDTALSAATITTLMGTPVTGSSTVTGTIAGTLPAFTAGITGSVRVTGTEAGTLPALTASLTGAARASGTVAGSLPAITASLTGALKAAGTLAGTLPGLTGNLSATLRVSASLAGTLPALTGSLAGNVSTPGTPVTGTLAATLGGLHGSIAAGVEVSGAISGALPSLTASFTGGVRVAASLTGSLPGIIAALVGTSGPVTPPRDLTLVGVLEPDRLDAAIDSGRWTVELEADRLTAVIDPGRWRVEIEPNRWEGTVPWPES